MAMEPGPRRRKFRAGSQEDPVTQWEEGVAHWEQQWQHLYGVPAMSVIAVCALKYPCTCFLRQL
jgi:hypothetical protein